MLMRHYRTRAAASSTIAARLHGKRVADVCPIDAAPKVDTEGLP
jgi:hypothetical protein